MQVEDISLTQIIIVLLFLGFLILLQQLLKNNKFGFQTHLSRKSRIRFIEDTALSNSERVKLIRIDDKEYLYFSSKGSSPTIIQHERNSTPGSKGDMELKRLNREKNTSQQSQKLKEKNSILSDAISNARKMNPKLDFKK